MRYLSVIHHLSGLIVFPLLSNFSMMGIYAPLRSYLRILLIPSYLYPKNAIDPSLSSVLILKIILFDSEFFVILLISLSRPYPRTEKCKIRVIMKNFKVILIFFRRNFVELIINFIYSVDFNSKCHLFNFFFT